MNIIMSVSFKADFLGMKKGWSADSFDRMSEVYATAVWA